MYDLSLDRITLSPFLEHLIQSDKCPDTLRFELFWSLNFGCISIGILGYRVSFGKFHAIQG